MSSETAYDDVKNIKGNAPDDTKKAVVWMLRLYRGAKNLRTTFANDIGLRIRVTEVDIKPMELAPNREEATVICEITVEDDMVNGGGNLHGGCSAYLIDLCSSLPLVAFVPKPVVSQSLNMVYHAPAPVGTPLRIINKTIAVGGRMLTARGEIWDVKNSRLVASGVHNKMDASKSKPSNKL